MPSDHIVDINNLHFSYGSHRVLKGINLNITRGRLVAILGPSGVGKTSLLKLIGGQLKPSSGSVKVAGQTVHELSTHALYALRRKIGMMFQQGGLLSDLTTYDNIAFPLREHTNLSERMIQDLVMMKLHAVGLRGAHELMTDELSGGMKRRVALARAIALDPMLVIYDEPFAGLDPISLNVVAHLIRRLNDALGITSIIVTYDISESLKVVDDLYFIDDGILVAEGPAKQIMQSDNPFVRQFIHAEPDGPVRFHMPSEPYMNDLRLSVRE